MARKIIIDLDAGIGDAFAAVLALLDPALDVVALTATAGCVSGPIATDNLQAIIEQIDPPKWPRLGSASEGTSPEHPANLAVADFGILNGPLGLGDCEFRVADLHHRHASSKLLADLVRTSPHEITILALGPLTNIAAACERMPEFLNLVEEVVCLGGSLCEGGDITAAAEFNMYLDPEAARTVFRSSESKTIVPLDVTSKVILTFEHFNRIAESNCCAGKFLAKLLPFSFRAHHQFLGMEGVLLREVTALAAISRPALFHTERMAVDIETRGELTRGATVFDRRRLVPQAPSNVSVATEVDAQGVLDYVMEVLLSE